MMDKQTKNDVVMGVMTVFFALLIDGIGIIPDIMSFALFGATISVGFLIAGGIGALVAAYAKKMLKF